MRALVEHDPPTIAITTAAPVAITVSRSPAPMCSTYHTPRERPGYQSYDSDATALMPGLV